MRCKKCGAIMNFSFKDTVGIDHYQCSCGLTCPSIPEVRNNVFIRACGTIQNAAHKVAQEGDWFAFRSEGKIHNLKLVGGELVRSKSGLST